jgi:hypothetical protein
VLLLPQRPESGDVNIELCVPLKGLNIELRVPLKGLNIELRAPLKGLNIELRVPLLVNAPFSLTPL